MSDRDIAAEGFDAGVAAATALCRAELAAMSERCLATMRKLNEQQTALTLEAVEAAYAGGWKEGAEAMREAALAAIGEETGFAWMAVKTGDLPRSCVELAEILDRRVRYAPIPSPEPPKEAEEAFSMLVRSLVDRRKVDAIIGARDDLRKVGDR